MAEFTEKIPQHRHCVNCGKAFVGGGQFAFVFGGFKEKNNIAEVAFFGLELLDAAESGILDGEAGFLADFADHGIHE
jgi:hypothetical protein